MRVNPADKVASLSVYTGESSFTTSMPPGNNTRQLVVAHQWSTRITLARVITSTDHWVSNGAGTIDISAVFIRNNKYAHLLQNMGKTSTLSLVVPHIVTVHTSFSVLFISIWKAWGPKVAGVSSSNRQMSLVISQLS